MIKHGAGGRITAEVKVTADAKGNKKTASVPIKKKES
jgi:hypothetical protein